MSELDTYHDKDKIDDLISHLKREVESMEYIRDVKNTKGCITKKQYQIAVENIQRLQSLLDYAVED